MHRNRSRNFTSTARDKARVLLAEAGYPEGFDSTIVCSNDPLQADYISIIKEQWSKVGINLSLDLKEPAVITGIMLTRSHQQWNIVQPVPPVTHSLVPIIPPERLQTVAISMTPNAMPRWQRCRHSVSLIPSKAAAIHKELMKYILDQAWAIPTPAPPNYVFWWPWIKNFQWGIQYRS